MAQNSFFYNNTFLNLVFTNKNLATFLFPKYLIRSENIHSIFSLYIDNYSQTFYLNSKAYRRIRALNLSNVGNSLLADSFIYKTTSLNFFQFEFLGKRSTFHNFASTFLSRLEQSTNLTKGFHVYKTLFGGYLGFSRGFIGFLPRKYFKSSTSRSKLFNYCFFQPSKTAACSDSFVIKRVKFGVLKNNWKDTPYSKRKMIFTQFYLVSGNF